MNTIFCIVMIMSYCHPALIQAAVAEEELSDSDCESVLISFATVTGAFTTCAIRNARPITLCRVCMPNFLKVKEVFDDILHLRDSGGKPCKDKLVNLDRLQVVDTGFKYAFNLWQKASCDSCYENMNKETPVLIKPVVDILNVSADLELCIKRHLNDSVEEPFYDPEVCKECEPGYLKMNYIYSTMKASTGDVDFCMDITDLMNSTRIQWSKELKCSLHKKKPEIIFLIGSGLVTGLTVIFYVLAFALTTKKEQRVAHLKRWSERRVAT